MMPSLEELLPHRAPMILIDAVESFDAAAKSVVTSVTVTPKSTFCSAGGVPNWVAVEYMAQTAAALVGLQDRAEGRVQRPGLLLGTRRLVLTLSQFALGRTYRIMCACVFEDGDAGSFECHILDGEDEVASATLNAYRPPDFKSFLQQEAV